MELEEVKNQYREMIENDKKIITRLEQKLMEEKENGRLVSASNTERRINEKKQIMAMHESELAYAREKNPEDRAKRIEVLKKFSQIVDKAIPDNVPLVFHGTKSLDVVQKIIETGGLFTPEQRDVSEKSFAAAIDVTWKKNINTSCQFAEPGVDGFLPYGAIFVFSPLKEEYEKVLKTGDGGEVSNGVEGVNFREHPERLFAIITTSENKERIEEWCKQHGWADGRVCTHDEFIERCIEQTRRVQGKRLKDSKDEEPYEI